MKMIREGCTFCKRQCADTPITFTACKAYNAYDLEWLMFCDECNDVLERYNEYISNFTRDWSKHHDPADNHYFTKQQLADAKDMTEFRCNCCGIQGSVDSEWKLDSPDDIDFLFRCEICSKKHNRRLERHIEYFIEDNSDYFQ